MVKKLLTIKTFAACLILLAMTAVQAQDCPSQRQDLRRQAYEIAKPKGYAASLGVTPLLYLAFVEGGAGSERVKSIEDLAKAIRILKPSLGSVETIRDGIVRGIRSHWEDRVRDLLASAPEISDRGLLAAFTEELAGAFPRAGYRAFSLDGTAIFNFAARDQVFSYHFFVSGTGNARTIRISQLRDAATPETLNRYSESMFRFAEGPWEDFIQRFFSKPGLLQFHARNIKPEARALGYDLIAYLHRLNLVDLSDDGILRFIARGDNALLEVLRQAIREGGEAGLAEALRSAGRRGLARGGEGWVILGGIALGVGVTIAWLSGKDDLERYVDFFADRSGLNEEKRPRVVEAFKIEDRNTLVEVIKSFSCPEVDVLWKAVFKSEDYPTR